MLPSPCAFLGPHGYYRSEDTYDYVVAGGGTPAHALADHLCTAHPALRVLLIEEPGAPGPVGRRARRPNLTVRRGHRIRRTLPSAVETTTGASTHLYRARCEVISAPTHPSLAVNP